ncbi:MAG: ammonium transporter [Clostridia bacterium]|nr:ammonium transporter [Clostridia bacterium]
MEWNEAREGQLGQNRREAPNKKRLIAILAVMVLVALAFTPILGHSALEAGHSASQTVSQEGFGTLYESIKYEKSIHIMAMLLVGFGFLMVFVRKHGFSSVTATFLVVSVSIPLYMLLKGMVEGEIMSTVSIDAFIFAEFAAASLLIAIGAGLGRLQMDQYVIMAMLFVPAYAFNEWLILESGYFKGFTDIGGSIVIHAFGAYFGLGVITNTLSKFKDKNECENDKMSNQLCLIGSMVLWIFWPSFTSALVAPDEIALTAINTVFALCGATISTYIFSKMLRGKIEIEDIANAALAGGVAIGTGCNVLVPGAALLVGIAAGALSTIGYAVIAPKVERLIKGTDTCGVHNLHGMPGILGGLTGVFFAGSAGVQLLGILTTLVIAYSLGMISGKVINLIGVKEVPYSDEDEFLVEHGA